VSDYAFPSNHAVVAAAMAIALFLISWRLGVLALIATALMGVSRVYVGAHYPDDVAAGLLVGDRGAAASLRDPVVEKLCDSRLRLLLTASPVPARSGR